MPQVAAITGAMSFDFSPYMHGMMQVQSITALFPQCVTNFIANPLLGLVGIMKDASHAITGMFSSFIERAHEAGEYGEIFGMSASQFSEFASVLGTGMGPMRAMGDTFKFLARSADDAARGNDTIMAAFGRLGISAADVQAGVHDLPGLLLKVSDGLKGLSGAERAGVALDILGRGAMENLPKLAQGSDYIKRIMAETRSFGASVGEGAAEGADRWMKCMQSIERAWEGVKTALTVPLLEGLMPQLDTLLAWMQEHPNEMKVRMENLANAIVKAFNLIGGAVEGLLNNFGKVSTGVTTLSGAWLGFKVGGPIGAVVGGVGGLGLGLYMNSGSGQSQPSVNIQNLNVQAPPLDQATTTRLAGALQAPLRDAMRQQRIDYEGQFKAASMAGGI